MIASRALRQILTIKAHHCYALTWVFPARSRRCLQPVSTAFPTRAVQLAATLRSRDSARMLKLASPVNLLLGVSLLLGATCGQAASNGRLPAWVCNGGQAPLFVDGFEAQAEVRHSEPTYGSGGDYPGAKMRTIVIGSQSRNYYLYVPSAYPSTDPLPVMLVLHGAGGPGTAPSAAANLRTHWAASAEAGGFIVVAPIASGSQGGWVPSVDYPMFQSVIDDVAGHYNIDLSRIHGWGFSAGGHVMHDLALHNYASVPNSETFAAYGISAGVLPALVCDGQSQPSCASFLPQVTRKIPAARRRLE